MSSFLNLFKICSLIVALDLENYDYNKNSKTLIRPTEGTIIERLPPRIEIRKDLEIEIPHILVFIDDPKNTVIDPLFKENLENIYDFELMMDSGHIKGYKIDNKDLIDNIAENLKKLINKDEEPILYAMGDGNHSFATAKSVWEELKKNAEDKEKIMDHPARYALVELVNLHDPGIVFEPIHRILFNIDTGNIFKEMEIFYKEQGSELIIKYML